MGKWVKDIRPLASRGQAAMELALVLPVIFILLFGVIEVGRAFVVYSEVTNAAREGARYGVVHPEDSTLIEAAVHSKLAIVSQEEVAVTVTYDDGAFPLTEPTFGDRVVVTVTHDLTLFIPIIADLIGSLHIEVASARTILGGE